MPITFRTATYAASSRPTRLDITRVGVDRARKAGEPAPDMAAPAVRRNGGIRCDVEDGPCACGAWHHSADTARRVAALISEAHASGRRGQSIAGFAGAWHQDLRTLTETQREAVNAAHEEGEAVWVAECEARAKNARQQKPEAE